MKWFKLRFALLHKGGLPLQQLSFTNANGDTVAFDNAAPYVFWKISGLEPPPLSVIKTQAPGQHGYSLEDLLLESRVVKLSGHVHARPDGLALLYNLRRRLAAVCNPLLGPGTLTYANDAGAYTTPAFCQSAAYGARLKSLQSLDITFECPGAFWLSAQQSVTLAYIHGTLRFPVWTPQPMGLYGYRAVAQNAGDVPAPLEFFIDGGSVNPVITNVTTGEFIKLARHVEPWNSLYINTDTLEVSLISIDPATNQPVRANAYGYLSLDSALFKLAPGRNVLAFESDDKSKDISVVIKYANRYVAV